MIERLIATERKRIDPHGLYPLLARFASVIPATDDGSVSISLESVKERGRRMEERTRKVGVETQCRSYA
jgi:hypothetical protein